MFYILKSEHTYNKSPEISYGSGTTMQFKRGYFIFDTENTNERYWEQDTQLEVNGVKYHIYEKMEHEIKIQAVFLKLKIEEMNNNSFNFFMPSSYKFYVDNYNKLANDYPEYLI